MTAAIETKRYEIPHWNIERLQNKVEALNRKAKKLKFSPIVFEVVGEIVKNISVEVELDHFPWKGNKLVAVRHSVIHITGERPQINGWTLVGTIEHLHTAETMIIAFNKAEFPVLEAMYKDGKPTCDHCRSNRLRNQTYVLRNESGEYKRVGKSCLRDFSSYTVHAVASMAEWYRGLCEIDRDSYGFPGIAVDVRQTLEYAAMAIRLHGWIASGTYGETSTIARAIGYMSSDLYPSEEDKALTEHRLLWIRSLVTEDAFLQKLQGLLMNEVVSQRSQTMIASLFIAYRKEEEAEELRKERAARKLSQKVGEVGDVMLVTATVTDIVWRDGYYGSFAIVNMTDDNGNKYVWFCNKDVWADDNDRITVRGTVKKHQVALGGGWETMLHYCSNPNKQKKPRVKKSVQVPCSESDYEF